MACVSPCDHSRTTVEAARCACKYLVVAHLLDSKKRRTACTHMDEKGPVPMSGTAIAEHEMRYRAGTFRLPGIPDGPAHWWCTCGYWRFEAKPMPLRKTGNNEIEARRAFGQHAVNKDGDP